MDRRETGARLEALRGRDDFLILAVETSCDDTSAAVTRGREVLSLAISSQTEIHRRFGGVVPEIASRNHTCAIGAVVNEALEKAGVPASGIDAVAVTYGAGLPGALIVGVSYAKAFAYAAGIPLMAVSHVRGHVAANYIADGTLEPPFLCLLVSGGHTQLIDVRGYTDMVVMGETRDDAAGEAFDKTARVLGLPYPGGPEIEKLAAKGKASIEFPRALRREKTLDFSYSGLKTAVVNYLREAELRGEPADPADVAASFQKAAVDALIRNAEKALKITGRDTLAAAGGVSANGCFRRELEALGKRTGVKTIVPPPVLCTDNAAMIGVCAYVMIRSGEAAAPPSLDTAPSLPTA